MRPNSIQSLSFHLKQNTTIEEFRKFADTLDNHAKLRVEVQKNGTYILKVSTKNSGTGVKECFFNAVTQRRNNTRIAIWHFANRVGASDLASTMREQMDSNQELTGADIKRLLAVQLPSKLPPPNRSLDDELDFLDMRSGTYEDYDEEGLRVQKDTVFNFSSDLKRHINQLSKEKTPTENEHLDELAKIWDKAMADKILSGKASVEAEKIYAVTKSFLDQEMRSPGSFNKGVDIFTVALTPERNMGSTLNALLMSARKGRLDAIEQRGMEFKFDIWLRDLKTVASLFTNQAYLRKIPENKRLQIGIAGQNMANLAKRFEDPAGEFQAMRRLAEYAKKSPGAFTLLVQGKLGAIGRTILEDEARDFDTQFKQDKLARLATRRANLKTQDKISNLKEHFNTVKSD
jgi:hypothetical protein